MNGLNPNVAGGKCAHFFAAYANLMYAYALSGEEDSDLLSLAQKLKHKAALSGCWWAMAGTSIPTDMPSSDPLAAMLAVMEAGKQPRPPKNPPDPPGPPSGDVKFEWLRGPR
jgi:hypothetical protein